MSRVVTIGAAQLGPIARGEPRSEVVERLCRLLREGAERDCDLVVFPELALTTFFPRWHIDDPRELDGFFETEMPGPHTRPLFDEAVRLGVGFHLGYAELTPDGHRYNTAIVVDADGEIAGSYRKVHLPGHEEPEAWRPFQHLERRYFEAGDRFEVFEGFGARIGLAICNDRRWPETYRELALAGAELILIGYNTPIHYAPDPNQDALAGFHSHLVMQAGAYQNGCWVVGVAKGGVEEGVDSLADSCIISPSGRIVALSVHRDDELVVARCDLDLCATYRETLFDFGRYRRPDTYRLISTAETSFPETTPPSRTT